MNCPSPGDDVGPIRPRLFRSIRGRIGTSGKPLQQPLDAATWRAVLERRHYPHALREVMGELMAASALLASNLKFTGSMIMQMQGSGPVSILVVECSGDLEMRAMAHWEGDPGGPLPLLLGGGRFVITLDPAEGRRKYQGVVALDGDTVADVLAHYMHSSEQLETRFWLAADGEQACGMLLQRMPHAGAAEAWSRALALAGTLGRGELLATPAATLMRRLFHEEDLRVFPERPAVDNLLGQGDSWFERGAHYRGLSAAAASALRARASELGAKDLQSLERDAGAGARSADDAGRRLTVGVYVYAEHDRQR